MKINNVNLRSSSVGSTSSDGHKIKKAQAGSFSSTFGEFERENEKEQLNKKMGEIKEKGKFVRDRMDLKDLLEYKKMVSEFLEYTVKFSYRYSKETKIGRDGSFKVMGVIEKINEDLENLTKEMMSNEKDKLKIVEKINGIEGLLVDMLM